MVPCSTQVHFLPPKLGSFFLPFPSSSLSCVDPLNTESCFLLANDDGCSLRAIGSQWKRGESCVSRHMWPEGRAICMRHYTHFGRSWLLDLYELVITTSDLLFVDEREIGFFLATNIDKLISLFRKRDRERKRVPIIRFSQRE